MLTVRGLGSAVGSTLLRGRNGGNHWIWDRSVAVMSMAKLIHSANVSPALAMMKVLAGCPELKSHGEKDG